MTYIIYHILGVKIGCTSNLERRIKDQGYLLTDVEILEHHEDIEIASQREIELQRLYGYQVEKISYKKWISQLSSEELSKNSKELWTKNREKMQAWKTPEKMSEMNKLVSRKSWDLNREKMTRAVTENVKKAHAASLVSPNRASLKMFFCEECQRDIKGAGAAGTHRKFKRHTVNAK